MPLHLADLARNPAGRRAGFFCFTAISTLINVMNGTRLHQDRRRVIQRRVQDQSYTRTADFDKGTDLLSPRALIYFCDFSPRR